jgi:bifunctional UDP-N-acetylglucosamine pyrophosphorylase / glucosamine-1-phosphate N-acetyltransferase
VISASASVAAVILAAGFGTRMKSALPKVLHFVAGRPMVEWCLEAAEAASGRRPVLVVGHGRDEVMAALDGRCEYAIQEELLGTAHALQQAAPLLEGNTDLVLVTYGDMPLLRGETLRALKEHFALAREGAGVALALLTVVREDPQGFGRIVRGADGSIAAIVEEVDCTPEQRLIRELNPGIYCFDGAWLWQNLPNVPRSRKGEYYLTDLVAIAVGQGRRVVTVDAPAEEVDGINTRVHLAQAEGVMRRRIAEKLMLAGVTILDPATTYIDASVEVGVDSVILPGTSLRGQSQIGRNAVIGPHSLIIDSVLGDRCRAAYSVIEQARIDDDSEIGPFGHLRKGAHLGERVHMGNFGEVKNSYLGPDSKMGHFSYLGDAHLEGNVNVGAGTITCNYDGVHKHKTMVGKDVFIGSDTMLVAPLTLGDGARTGAGSVVTHDVPPHGLVYGVPARPPHGSDSPSTEEKRSA